MSSYAAGRKVSIPDRDKKLVHMLGAAHHLASDRFLAAEPPVENSRLRLDGETS